MLASIQKLLNEKNEKLWVMYNTEGSDYFFKKYVSDKLDTATICFLSNDIVYILVSSLDKGNVEHLKYSKEKIRIIVYDSVSDIEKYFEEIIAKLNFPNKINLSYSTMSDKNTDILTHGNFLKVTKLLKAVYSKYSKNVKFQSAENIIYEIASKRSEIEIKRLKLIANITDRILEETFKNIKVGMTEIDIYNSTIKMTDNIMKLYIGTNNISLYSYSWENCPIVLIGENLAKGGHTLPSNKILQRGDTIYFDFGIEVTFDDNMILCTDMQRMGYSLKQDEKVAPYSVQRVFDTLVESIEEGMEALKAGTKAYIVDDVVRKKILKAGYPNYMHATGHPVGYSVHDIGAVISIKSSPMSKLKIVENGVYTLEPRIAIANGGSIEEMFQATKFGGVPLCNPQRKIYLVK
ncbi:MAG: M24 family metallopeptidase [Clostridia bacterium]